MVAVLVGFGDRRTRGEPAPEGEAQVPRPVGRRRFRLSRLGSDILVGLITGLIAVSCTAFLDDRRSERELARTERSEWRFTLLTVDDLRHADLSDADLSGLIVNQKDLRETRLAKGNLQRAVINSSRLDKADFANADLSGSSWRGSSLQKVDLTKAQVDDATFEQVDLSGSTLSRDFVARARVSKVCYSATTAWLTPPPDLDWQSCWNGSSTRTPAERARPAAITCGYGDASNPIADYFGSLRLTRERACAYLGYLDARGAPKGHDIYAIVGRDVCSRYDAGSDHSLAQVQDLTTELGTPDRLSADIVLGAVTWLCPQYKSDLYSELWPAAFE